MRTLGLPTRRLLPLAIGLAAALTAVPAPAQAAVVGSTHSDDLVLYRHCQRHAIDYTVAIPDGTTFWKLNVQVLDPDGHTSEGNVADSATSDGTGTFKVRFCGSETPGTYTVRATGFTENAPLVNMPFSLPDSTFEVRRAATTTKLTQERLADGRRLTIKVREQAKHGSIRPDGTVVKLQRKVDGSWVPIRGTRTQVFNGRTTMPVHAKPGTRIRAVALGGGNYAGSTSRAMTLR